MTPTTTSELGAPPARLTAPANGAVAGHTPPIRVALADDRALVRHGLRLIASSYRHDDAIAEAREFLRERPYVRAGEIQRTLATHRSW